MGLLKTERKGRVILPALLAIGMAACAPASADILKGAVQGCAYVDHVVRGGAGQMLKVTLQARHPSLQFNVIAPGVGDVAMFTDGSAARPFERVLPVAGRYVVRVYFVRASARRGAQGDYTLRTALEGEALKPLPGRVDARVPGTRYHATASMPCAPPYAPPEVKRCDAAVTRYASDGTATVTLRWGKHSGQQRRILFAKGVPVSADATEAPAASRAQDTTTVRFGSDERYEIVDALFTGG